MRRVLVLLLVALALLWAPASNASTSSTGSASLTIVTVPAQPGVRFQLGDSTVATGADGTAEIAAAPGIYPLRLLDTAVRRPGVRSTFSRWGDDSFQPSRTVRIDGQTRLEVGFEQSVLVGFRFVDRSGRPVDMQRVSRLTLASATGTRESFRPDREHWLLAGRVARRFNGLELTRIQYAVEGAVVDGSNVVNRSAQRFLPLESRDVAIRLLLYSARLGAHDLIFGFPVGKSLELVYPDGHRVTHELHGRQLVLHGLPRGTYRVEVHASGYSPVVSLALSRDQDLELRIVSYLDVLVVAVVVLVLTGVLVLLPRPRLREKLRRIAVRAARIATSRMAALARRARSADAPAGFPRVRLSRPPVPPSPREADAETVAEDAGAAIAAEEAQAETAARLPRWVPLPLDAAEPAPPEPPSRARLQRLPSAATRYVRAALASGRRLSAPALAHARGVPRAPSPARWIPLPLEEPARAAVPSPAVAPDAVVQYIRELIASGQTVPTRGLRRFRAEGGRIRTKLWFETFNSIARELASEADASHPSRPVEQPPRPRVRYEVASGARW